MNTYGKCKLLKEWSAWDNAIHDEEKQVDRQRRSQTYPFTFSINRKNETATFSSTSSLPFYETSLSSCTCFDFQDRKLPCKHIYRLASELGYIEIVNLKPTRADILSCDSIDDLPAQKIKIERAKRIKASDIKIDFASRTGVFFGSGKMPYETTEKKCTCISYAKERLPCKHIYRLRMELEQSGIK